MKKWLIAILFGVVLALAACGGGGDNNADNNANNNADSGNVEVSAAEEVYQNSCRMCHGGNLDDGSAPVELSTIGSKYTAEQIEDIIENGIGSMPPQKQVSADDRELLANWLADMK